MLEAKAAYFIPTDSRTRKIYSETGIYGVNLRFPVYKCLVGWSQASYLRTNGKTLGLKNHTTIQMAPLVLGLQCAPQFTRFQPYIGLGIDVAYLNVRNSSPYMIHIEKSWGVGGIAAIGALIGISESVFFDFFGEYSYLKIPFHKTNHRKVVPNTADMSSVALGGGVGYRF